jgi:acetyltransferase-like isoleucine patch superfamily enzyme
VRGTSTWTASRQRPFGPTGADALIGAAAVVSREIPAAVVAFGNPVAPRREVAGLQP